MSGSYSYHHPSFLPWSCPYIPPQQYNTIQSCQPSYPQSPPTSSPWQCPVCPTQEHPVNAVSNLADLTTDSSFPSPYFSPSNNRLTAQVPSQTQAQDTRSISELSPVLGPNSTESRLERIPQLQERISSHQTKVDRLASLLEERIHRLETTHTRADAEAHQQGLQALTQILAEIHDHQVDLPPHPRYQRDPPLTLAEYEREVYQTFSEPPGIRETGSIPDMSNETVDPRVLCSKSPSTPSPPDLVSSQISTDLSGTESLYGEHEEMSSIYNESQALITLESFSQSPESKAEPERAPTADSYHEPSHRRSEADLGYENETETKALSSTVSASKKRGAPLPPTDSVRRLRDRSKTAAPSSLSTDKVPARPATLPKRAKFTTTGRTSSRGTRSLKDLSEKEKGKKKKATPMTYLPYGTLGTSNGVARVPGVNWPKKGPNTVRGVAKDVQCEKCQGRLHWPCAGLKENETLGVGDWICPDCLHLAKSGLPPLPTILSDDCVRSDCIRRKRQKMLVKPGDAQQYFTECPIGRRTSVPATLTSGARFEYLIKWWGYPLDQSTWEPTESFGNPSEIADHFIDLAMDEGVSPEMMRGGIVLLNQAKEAFDDQGMLKTV